MTKPNRGVLFVQALGQRKRLLEEKHPPVATSLNNLAELYYYQGRHDQAKKLLVETLGQTKRLLDVKHLSVVTSLDNLAALYYDQAEEFLVEALKQKKWLLGEKHPSIATSLNNLASLYDFLGRHDEAEPLYLQALVLFKDLLETYPEC
ncbi:tetratricopeptide repeat protein [Nostoc sp. CALU 1950]|uniref:tetratricopeptide repeat protein n=1 Tax=Nostoc sp. CALU 1950 TaxID=3104321 RepID=UPI003EBD1270